MSVLFAVSALSAAVADQVCTTQAACAGQGVGTFIGTPARIWASVAALVALAGVVAGSRALVRSRRRPGAGGRVGPVVALVAGLLGAVNGGLVLAVADGGLGTGNGVAGGAAALVLGLVAAVLGGLVLARSRRTELTS